ncbi:hypothetical protein GGX14DRAFT_413008 [Mycena pura]|uniref:SAP domain-containing protein n=1 Tax=Mycena pura TaxID=153505 RepID=A0AAD6YT37_9AGAR|nr:hypothetical protein GGX14DRAFT_413008 [Mycena pura]
MENTPENTPCISSSQVAAAAEHDSLIFPDKEGGSVERSFTGKTCAQLKDMCRDYNLHISGNKTQLHERLRRFSEKFCSDPTSCNVHPAKRRNHKGPREESKKTTIKKSATRRAAIIDTERITERSKDVRTEDEVAGLLRWADRTCARLPYKPLQPRTELSLPREVPSSSQSSLSNSTLLNRMQAMEGQLAMLTRGAALMQSGPPGDRNIASVSSAPRPAYLTSPIDYVAYNHTLDSSPSLSGSTLITPTSEPPAGVHRNLPILETSNSSDTPVQSSNKPNGITRSIKLGDDTTITITADEISRLSIPATSFAEDIERLNAMWDDTSPYWKNESVVKIHERSIALIYLPEIFKKSGSWSAYKSNWTEWKFLVERYRLESTPDEFWAVFTGTNGRKMSYTAICTAIRKERKSADELLADQARREYGDEFKVKFRYRCSRTNEMKVMAKANAIAKEYRKLRHLN